MKPLHATHPRRTDLLKALARDAWVNFAAHPLGWPLAQLARGLGPIIRVPGLGVVVSGFEAGHDILTRDREFTKNGDGSLSAVLTQALGRAALSNMDGEEHRRLRARLKDLLTPARADAMVQSCGAPLDEAARALEAGRIVDLVTVAQAVSGRVTLAMIGATPGEAGLDEAARDICALAASAASSVQLRPLSQSKLRRVRTDLDRLTAYARAASESPAPPESSLVQRLRTLGLDAEETRGVLSIFFLAGTLTSAVALPRIVALLIDSGAMSTLRADPGLVARAVDEGLRFVAPVPATVRIAAADADVRKQRIGAGARVIVMTASMARDPALYERPHAFDITRDVESRARFLWYGAGPHFCIGFPLAQRQMAFALSTLAVLRGDLRIVQRRVAFGALLPAYSCLRVRLVR